jgi:hypothetical protein
MTAVPHRASRWIAAAVLAAGAIGVVLELAHVDSPVRAPLVLLFLVAAPALAVAGLMPGVRGLARLVIAIAAAIVIDALVAIVLLAAGVWSAKAGLLAVAAISAVGLAAQLPPIRARAARRSKPASEPVPGTGGSAPAEIGDAVTAQFGSVAPARPARAPRPRPAAGARTQTVGGAPGGPNGQAWARPGDEATLQMPAVNREPQAGEAVTVSAAVRREAQGGEAVTAPAVHREAQAGEAATVPATVNREPQAGEAVTAPAAVQREPRVSEAATARYATVRRDQPGTGRAGSHGQPDQDGGPRPADGAGPRPQPADGTGSSGQATDEAGRGDKPADTDDATVQFPKISLDE